MPRSRARTSVRSPAAHASALTGSNAPILSGPSRCCAASASSTRLPIASAICCRYGRETERRDAVELISSAMLIGGHNMAPDRLVIDLDQRARIGGRKLPPDDRSARSKDAMTAALVAAFGHEYRSVGGGIVGQSGVTSAGFGLSPEA